MESGALRAVVESEVLVVCAVKLDRQKCEQISHSVDILLMDLMDTTYGEEIKGKKQGNSEGDLLHVRS